MTNPDRQSDRHEERLAQELLMLVSQLTLEMNRDKKRVPRVTLKSRFDSDLKLDSLSRVELFQRVERHFDIHLSAELLASAETPQQLLQGILTSSKSIKNIDTLMPVDVQPMTEHDLPELATTLLEVLRWHQKYNTQRTHIYLYEDQDTPDSISYDELYQQSRRLAAGLQYYGLKPKQTVAIMLPTGRDYLFSYFAILFCGAIPVPIYPPTRPSQIEEHLKRHVKILNNAQSVLLLTINQAKLAGNLLKTQVPSLKHILVADDLSKHAESFIEPKVRAEDIAFLQYTSGSTGTPKGVILTHQNLLANIRAMGEVVEASSSDVFVSWLPLYHDMGLIGAWLGSLYFASPLVLMSPITFLTRPERWLWAIHKHRGTLSAAPNFAYEFCLNKVQDRDIESLNLSSWRMAFNGAEPVNADTLIRFAERFKSYGFDEKAISPVYGLAECAVGLTFPPPGRGALIDSVERDMMQSSALAKPIETAHRSSQKIAACGHPLPGYEIRIVDEAGRELPERHIGFLQFKGPSATQGYYQNPQQTKQLYDGEWLNTGDLAYIVSGELYLTGRSKEIIIRAGRNIFPYEIELAIGAIPGIRKGCVAVFGTHKGADNHREIGTERIIVLAETRETDSQEQDKLHQQVAEVASDLLMGNSPDEILILPPHSVLKTSSGKIRRTACRELFEQGTLHQKPRPLAIQLIRVAVSGIVPAIKRYWSKSKQHGYASWAWVWFALMAPVSWLLVMITPTMGLRQKLIRYCARLFCFLTFSTPKTKTITPPNSSQAQVIVCNHASYLDGLLLMAGLNTSFYFVAKAELQHHFISHWFLKRLGCLFVERFDVQHSTSDTQQILAAVKQGHSILIFPEGTFTRASGLRAFKMGAFLIAAQSQVPVLPVTIRGSRSLLKAGSWYPRYSDITIMISKAIQTKQKDSWQAALELRQKSRNEILNHCGEPDLEN
jgi:1-acyl-sn-glycerol-3-phosphate acyltransferase